MPLYSHIPSSVEAKIDRVGLSIHSHFSLFAGGSSYAQSQTCGTVLTEWAKLVGILNFGICIPVTFPRKAFMQMIKRKQIRNASDCWIEYFMPEGSYFWRNTTYCHDAIFFSFSMTGRHAFYRSQTQNMWWTKALFSESPINQAYRFVSCTNMSSEAFLQPQGFRVHANHQIIRWASFSCKHLCQYCSLHRAGCHLLLEICCWGTVFELARGVTHG